ncbi:hypothetical protein DdX_19211 [Ditylenchus destructor]|uniref:Uncharacterized protein n=1 Tax=Ditylenchus destructor TaxID=166010 RepID=A0AAD4MKV0_9BILA|nr:hypothetical protein DdX_19211 [Ditylenchus destructor]
MDSSPNQPQASSSRRDDTEKARKAAIAKREKQQQRLEKFAAAKQAKLTRRRQQGGMPNLQLVRQARPQLRRQESAQDLVPLFNPLYPQEERGRKPPEPRKGGKKRSFGRNAKKNIYAAIQINGITHLDLHDGRGHRTIRWFAIGDYKYLRQVFGLKGGNANYPCVICHAKKEGTYDNYDCSFAVEPRSNDDPIDEAHGKIRRPLFTIIPPEQMALPMLHYFLGPREARQTRRHAISGRDNLPPLQGNEEPCAIPALHRQAPKDTHDDHHASTALWLLKKIWDSTESKFLSPDELDTLARQIEDLLAHMQQHFPDRNLKQKGHVFFRHAMEYARRWGNLTYFYEHGIEQLHASTTDKRATTKWAK